MELCVKVDGDLHCDVTLDGEGSLADLMLSELTAMDMMIETAAKVGVVGVGRIMELRDVSQEDMCAVMATLTGVIAKRAEELRAFFADGLDDELVSAADENAAQLLALYDEMSKEVTICDAGNDQDEH